MAPYIDPPSQTYTQSCNFEFFQIIKQEGKFQVSLVSNGAMQIYGFGLLTLLIYCLLVEGNYEIYKNLYILLIFGINTL